MSLPACRGISGGGPRRLASSLAAMALVLAFESACADPQPPASGKADLPVRTEIVRAGPHAASIGALGTVRPAETAPLVAVLGGRIRYPARFERGLKTGAAVHPGETLALFENERLRLELAEARLHLGAAEAELERKRVSFQAGIISESEFSQSEINSRLAAERLASAERRAEDLALKSPGGGHLVVLEEFATGLEVAPGTKLAELAFGGSPKVEGWAAASDLESLRPGLRVVFVAPGAVAESGEGRLSEVSSVIDEAGTVRIVATVTDARGLPPPGEGVEMRVELERSAFVITVPEEALIVSSGGAAAYLVEGRGNSARARRVAVALGRRGAGRVVVRSGLSDGDRVAVSGVSLLSDGASVVETEGTAGRAVGEGEGAAAPHSE